jgi:hypothetical protein
VSGGAAEPTPGYLWKTDLTDEEERAAGLTVCDPARGLSKEEAAEILTALGLKEDPNHTEFVGKRDT